MTKRSERKVVDRLGEAGLRRALDDVLDAGRLVRLANACGLRYPGSRTRTQKRDRILSDLAVKAIREEAACKTVVKMLRKETAKEARAWRDRTVEERVALVREDESAGEDGSLGLRLFLLADGPEDAATEPVLAALVGSFAEGSGPEPVAPSEEEVRPLRREITRLRKRTTELQKKIQHLEGQLAKTRETEKTLKRDLIQRKGELAESRMLAERLRRDLEEARGTARAAGSGTEVPQAVEERVAELRRAIRRLSTEQRKLVHAVTRGDGDEPPAPVVPPEALAPVMEAVEELRSDFAALRRERKRDVAEYRKRVDRLRSEIVDWGSAGPRPASGGRRAKGTSERVGVFVDVQNMWYSARQLKGKLDFDALLQAAVLDRRLIRATAYVVETKEIDQSGFIAMLQQRGIEVRRKTLTVRSDGSMKGDWDMEMALDILDAASALDVVCLVSGDGDFTSLVHRVKAIGPRVEVLGFPRNTAKALIEAADRFQPLDRKFMIRSKERAQA